MTLLHVYVAHMWCMIVKMEIMIEDGMLGVVELQ